MLFLIKKKILDNLISDFFFSIKARALSASGGKDDGEATRRIVSSIVGHELALRMNWIGSPFKKAIVEFPHVIKLVASKLFDYFAYFTKLLSSLYFLYAFKYHIYFIYIFL